MWGCLKQSPYDEHTYIHTQIHIHTYVISIHTHTHTHTYITSIHDAVLRTERYTKTVWLMVEHTVDMYESDSQMAIRLMNTLHHREEVFSQKKRYGQRCVLSLVICIHVYMLRTYIHIQYVYMYTHACIYTYVCTTHMRICMHIPVYVHTCVRAYLLYLYLYLLVD